ncbi:MULTISPECIES: cupin domain-containing protein [unclassified Ensifer]|uniref:cupin domain-containing protein n=1 Tax=unclassified Ensifer TaxID=2633371 RepID=UPI000813CFB5|nr:MULTISPECIES: cupin domain-containing protein [unclassified Ensifer]OCO98836.1 hypothetical protein BC362_28005 [Ensifer sp. LC14]OCP02665.1 hypothetical protein BBX50_27645 [Ensifer sp. LC11]OCP02999.1 hypothetical protein BC374_27655 [Ensifer sp. LC13]OCP29930.1 hypothetical protein BC364_27760 [Ensifer sp. LC499]
MMKLYNPVGEESGLADWGKPEDIGAVTVEGDVRVAGRFDLGSPQSEVFGGVFVATRGQYRLVYAFHEHATLLSGRLELTDEITGQTISCDPGDSWIIAKGTPVLWTIVSDRISKSYVAATRDI